MAIRVKVLPPEVVSKIAAGEVIERPASVLKELMENSLDAGATRIEVRAEGGGVHLLEVSDDGEGMESEDAIEALRPHATSKIRTLDDLLNMQTFGFRGEALSSILSVSKMELITRPPNRDEATRVLAQGGRILEVSPWGSPVGTTIRVESLFHNVPARLKFLRSQATEAAQLRETFRRIAVVHPEVSFSFSYEVRRPLDFPSRKSWWDRVKEVMDQGVYEHLLEVKGGDELCAIEGFLSQPNCHRSSAGELWLYVNRRPIQDKGILAAILRGYGELLPKGRYPVGVINIGIRGGELDVNVHPAKREVRFRDPGKVQEIIFKAVRSMLRGLSWSLGTFRTVPEVKEPFLEGSGSTEPWRPLSGGVGLVEHPGVHVLENKVGFPPEQEELSKQELGESVRYLGQVGGVYLVFAKSDGLLIVDQHATHERVLFEELRTVWDGGRMPSQGTLGGEIVCLDPHKDEVLRTMLPTLERLGWSIEAIAKETWKITRVPPWVGSKKAGEFLQELIGEAVPFAELTPDELLARIACKAAVKKARPVAPEEAIELLHRISTSGYKGICPHGRPTVIEISLHELQRRFGRS